MALGGGSMAQRNEGMAPRHAKTPLEAEHCNNTGTWPTNAMAGDHNTVVPATAGPLGERPPALAGHFCDVPTTLSC